MSDYMPTDDAGWRRWVNKQIDALMRRPSALGGAGGPFRVAAGSVAGAVVAAGGTVVTPIVFPEGRFLVPPIVVCTVVGNGITNRTAGVLDPVAAEGFSLMRGNTGASSVTVAATWYAVQMTPDSAAG